MAAQAAAVLEQMKRTGECAAYLNSTVIDCPARLMTPAEGRGGTNLHRVSILMLYRSIFTSLAVVVGHHLCAKTFATGDYMAG
jgi:hypothetical protein